jgi:hypothetical protein
MDAMMSNNQDDAASPGDDAPLTVAAAIAAKKLETATVDDIVVGAEELYPVSNTRGSEKTRLVSTQGHAAASIHLKGLRAICSRLKSPGTRDALKPKMCRTIAE